MKTFSINAAAELLEKDRATVTRALRNVPACETLRGARRWRLRVILDAIERNGTPSSTPRPGDGKQAELTAAYARLDLAVEQLRALPTLAERRAAALALVPLIEQADALAHQVAVAAGEHPTLTQLRLGKLFTMTVRGFERPCNWGREEAMEHLGGFDDEDADAA